MTDSLRYMAPQTVVNVLYNVRGQIVREGLDGLEHVDALLRLWGADPEGRHVPRKVDVRFGRRELRRLIWRALQDGPKRGCEIAREVATARPDLTYREIQKLVTTRLFHMLERGQVGKEGRLWRKTVSAKEPSRKA